jgi:thiol-disulfide isomerase/thioredoxin
MEPALILARLVLAAVFLFAGLAKLGDLAGSRRTMADFGIPIRVAAHFGTVLPILEIGVAVSLIATWTAWWGAIACVLLLFGFSMAVVFNLLRGRAPACRCFGQFSSAPIGWSTVARNVGLLAAAVFVIWQGWADPGPDVFGWIAELSGSERLTLGIGSITTLLLLGQFCLILQLVKQQGRILLRVEAVEQKDERPGVGTALPASGAGTAGRPIGTIAPEFQLEGLQGEKATLGSLLAPGKPVLLLFTHPGCAPCQALMSEVSQWQRLYAASLTIAIISEGPDANLSRTLPHGVGRVLLQEKREVAELYQVWGTPAAVLIRAGGRVGSVLAQGSDAIRALVAGNLSPATGGLPTNGAFAGGNGHGAGDARPVPSPSRARIGIPAAPLQFRDLHGNSVALADFYGRRTLVLFWNSSCGFCAQMLGDLRKWDAALPRDAPRLLVISTGTAEEARSMGLRSPILLDPELQAGAAFGASGTPMAVLLDENGRIGSDVAVGAQAVFALAGVGRAADVL